MSICQEVRLAFMVREKKRGDVRCRGSVEEDMDHAARLREESCRSKMRGKEGCKGGVRGRESVCVLFFFFIVVLLF